MKNKEIEYLEKVINLHFNYLETYKTKLNMKIKNIKNEKDIKSVVNHMAKKICNIENELYKISK